MVGFIRSFTQNADTGSDLDSIRALSKKRGVTPLFLLSWMELKGNVLQTFPPASF